MSIILDDRLGGSRCIVKSVLGKNPKGFPTQRAVLEEEDQLRWVGGFSSRIVSSSVRLPGLSLACGPNHGLHGR